MKHEATPPRDTLPDGPKSNVAVTAILDRDPHSTITPDPGDLDDAGRRAIALLGQLGARRAGIELRATLGEGGMGIVHAGVQHSLGREVAVKTLRPEVRSEATTLQLLREAWATGALEHPNVVPIYDISLDVEGYPQIVLKKIAGSSWAELMHDAETVRKRFRANHLLDWNLRILMQVCNAIQFAHSRGVLHRDLKPDNVMIGGFGEVYVLDWGIAVSLRDDDDGRLPLARHATEIAGTPCYMAPEMFDQTRAPLSPRTDVYQLGAILFEVVAARPPHDGASLEEIMRQAAR